MYFVMVMVSFQTCDVETWIADNARTVYSVENRTHHGKMFLNPNFMGQVEGSYSSLSSQMSGCVASLTGILKQAAFLRLALKSSSEYQWPQNSSAIHGVVDDLQTYAAILKQRLEFQELEVHLLERRANLQLTALFNLITQQEFKLSIDVAPRLSDHCISHQDGLHSDEDASGSDLSLPAKHICGSALVHATL